MTPRSKDRHRSRSLTPQQSGFLSPIRRRSAPGDGRTGEERVGNVAVEARFELERAEPAGGALASTCYRCRRFLPVEAFAADKSKASGRKSICRACDRAKSRAYYVANRERKIAAVKARREGRA